MFKFIHDCSQLKNQIDFLLGQEDRDGCIAIKCTWFRWTWFCQKFNCTWLICYALCSAVHPRIAFEHLSLSIIFAHKRKLTQLQMHLAWHGILQQRNLMRALAISLDVDCKCVNYMITAFGYDPLTNDQIQVKCAIKCAFSSSCMNGCLLCTTLLFDRLSQFFVFLSLIFFIIIINWLCVAHKRQRQ